MEEWRQVPVEEFKECYLVSSSGRLWNNRRGHHVKIHLRNAYPSASLHNTETKKQKTFNVHRLVAGAFLGNVGSLVVNHKNGNKQDNRVENLELVTHKENTAHANRTGLHVPHRKAVLQYDLSGNLLASFLSIIEAERQTGCSHRHISLVCKGTRKTTGGYVWKYANETEQPPGYGKEIPGFENYLVTKDGRIYSKRSKKWLRPKKTADGHATIGLCDDGIRREVSISHLIDRLYPDRPVERKIPNRESSQKGVIQYDKDGNEIAVYSSIKEASGRTNVDASSIVRVCRGKQKSAGGYWWKYQHEEQHD